MKAEGLWALARRICKSTVTQCAVSGPLRVAVTVACVVSGEEGLLHKGPSNSGLRLALVCIAGRRVNHAQGISEAGVQPVVSLGRHSMSMHLATVACM